MLVLIVFAITLVLSLGIILGTFVWLKKQVVGSAGAGRDEVIGRIKATDKEVHELLARSDGFASKAQLNSLITRLEAVKKDLEKDKATLLGLEPKLDTAQKNVEEKEAQQQEIKSAKEEDEVALKNLLESYENISGESVALEQKLAASLKNLDTIMNEVQMTAEQKAVLQELSNSLSSTGAVLRDLMMDYESINERLNNLKAQLNDLEDEYTKLVERQLGE